MPADRPLVYAQTFSELSRRQQPPRLAITREDHERLHGREVGGPHVVACLKTIFEGLEPGDHAPTRAVEGQINGVVHADSRFHHVEPPSPARVAGDQAGAGTPAPYEAGAR